MKVEEMVQSIRDNEEFYGGRMMGLVDLFGDIEDALEEGYIEGVSARYVRSSEKVRISCEDGIIWVSRKDGKLNIRVIGEPKPEDVRPTTRRGLSPYERTRAMVYATGNKWAIENFNATH